ncbi:hypothetical protein ACF08M_11905 [Streptomyces sp. NPDC015032]|uniref:hypothetical protein n=1 Tax=Streptomyces sp. NPDC015032 TaxID=3364937 RepID=UPI0036FCC7D2
MPSRTRRSHLLAELSAAPGHADGAAPEMRGLMGELRDPHRVARTSRIRARSIDGPRVADTVRSASPGGAAVAHTPVTGRAGRDGDRAVGVARTRLQPALVDTGFGMDAVSPGSGAGAFATGGGHRDHLKPGSVPLKNIARSVAGTATPAELSGERHA